MPSDPPTLPIIVWNICVPNIHRCRSSPRLPSGFSRHCSVPAPKPSSEIEKPATRTFGIPRPFRVCPYERFISLSGPTRLIGNTDVKQKSEILERLGMSALGQKPPLD